MTLVKESDVRAAAQRALRRRYPATAQRILKEQRDAIVEEYDVFLSHSIHDAEIVLGAKQLLEEKGKKVYVDWIDDPELDRSNVTARTAQRLRWRMQNCAALFYLHSRHSRESKWMPWELGYFDGRNGNVAILPVLADWEDTFDRQEYLGLYPYVDMMNIGKASAWGLWINKPPKRHMSYSDWIGGKPWA